MRIPICPAFSGIWETQILSSFQNLYIAFSASTWVSYARLFFSLALDVIFDSFLKRWILHLVTFPCFKVRTALQLVVRPHPYGVHVFASAAFRFCCSDFDRPWGRFLLAK
jgi:hypothetical protein